MGVNLVASLIIRNELRRYLEPCVAHLLEFCDEVRIWDDASDEPGWPHDLNGAFGGRRVMMHSSPRPQFFEHEGRARNAALAWTMEARPTHVLAIDADELVSDGQVIRAACEENSGQGLWSLVMEEVWQADTNSLWTREDGGWRKHPVGILWRVPPGKPRSTAQWRIADRQLACGRVPVAFRRFRATPLDVSVLHFGWTNPAERQARYDRYVEHDGGKFHASAHLRSILGREPTLRRREWPAELDRDKILERAGMVPA